MRHVRLVRGRELLERGRDSENGGGGVCVRVRVPCVWIGDCDDDVRHRWWPVRTRAEGRARSRG
jgi:hypothetical protein